MSLLTTPERLAMILLDCHPSINGAYHYTQEAIDQIERPCWLIFNEGASYSNTTARQEIYTESYSLAYVGHVFNAGGYSDFTPEYELLARQVAVASVKYLFEHQQLQMSNCRELFPQALPSLNGVMNLSVDGRSPVTLYTRDGVASGAFWGFTIDLSVKEQFAYRITT